MCVGSGNDSRDTRCDEKSFGLTQENAFVRTAATCFRAAYHASRCALDRQVSPRDSSKERTRLGAGGEGVMGAVDRRPRAGVYCSSSKSHVTSCGSHVTRTGS